MQFAAYYIPSAHPGPGRRSRRSTVTSLKRSLRALLVVCASAAPNRPRPFRDAGSARETSPRPTLMSPRRRTSRAAASLGQHEVCESTPLSTSAPTLPSTGGSYLDRGHGTQDTGTSPSL